MNTKEVEVKFLGKSFVFNIPGNIPTEDFLGILDFVESKYRRIRREAGDLDAFKLGLLAAVNLAEELFTLKKEYELLKNLVTKIDKLLPPLDSPGIDSVEKNRMPILFQLE